jgi:dephospho-CoA kinase
MPVFAVVCARCQKDKYPTLAERPESYVCVLCVMVPEETRITRKASRAKMLATKAKKKKA